MRPLYGWNHRSPTLALCGSLPASWPLATVIQTADSLWGIFPTPRANKTHLLTAAPKPLHALTPAGISSFTSLLEGPKSLSLLQPQGLGTCYFLTGFSVKRLELHEDPPATYLLLGLGFLHVISANLDAGCEQGSGEVGHP